MARRGRKRGSYTQTPQKLGRLWDDAQTAVQLGAKPTKRAVAEWLRENMPDRYRTITSGQIRQLLQRAYESYRTPAQLDEVNAAIWARLLGEAGDD
jgi:hypothetical protein